jgi:hypothetical protein
VTLLSFLRQIRISFPNLLGHEGDMYYHDAFPRSDPAPISMFLGISRSILR